MKSVAVLLVAAAAVADAATVMRVKDLVNDHLGGDLSDLLARSPRASVADIVGTVSKSIGSSLSPFAALAKGTGPPPDIPGSYYAFIPAFEGAAKLPGLTPSFGANVPRPAPAASVTINSRCFSSASASGVPAGTDPKTGAPQFDIVFSMTGQVNSTCDEMFLLGTVADVQIVVIDEPGTHNVTIAAPDSPAGSEEWVARNGVRVFRFYGGVLDTIGQLLDTVSLFVPSLTSPTLDAESMKLNRDLMANYANVKTYDRNPDFVLTGVDPSFIQTGDLLAISRADGLATFEMLGTGEATSHTAMPVWIDGELFVVESTDTTNYWKNPNIQKTLWKDWVPMAMEANYTIALLQLRDDVKTNWNQTAVEEWISYTLGFPYGYHNFLNTFYDVPGGNLPKPLDWHAIEVVFRLIEDIAPSITQRFVIYAMSFRLTQGKNSTAYGDLVSVYNEAAKQGMTFGDLFAMVEHDGWIYPDGPSMVCDVYVCSLWKAAGVYRNFGIADDELNCVEDTNYDVYALNLFKSDSSILPQVCQTADPGSPFCYIMGAYSFELKNFNTVTPYPHMAEHCSGQWPNYTRPPNC